jgi:hypothetical protein
MNNDIRLEHSRIIATANSLGAMAGDCHSFTDKAVLLIGDYEVLATRNGSECFLCCVRLLMRMVTKLTICLPKSGPLADAVLREVDRIAGDAKPEVKVGDSVELSGFDAILCVGTTGKSGLPWTVVNSNGWLVRVSSLGQSISAECSQWNPIGALGAACFGVAEVFKRLIVLRPERGELSPARPFSFYDYSETENPGPELPSKILVDLVLFGAGAIGNGIVHLLSGLPIVGKADVVDRQVFQVENQGTCFLIGPREMGISKAQWASGVLRSPKLTSGWLQGSVEDYLAQCSKTFQFPRLALDGLDNIPGRRSVQGMWPDQVIDGAIGPTICEVTVHPWDSGYSCLRCDFREPDVDAAEVQAQASGLAPVRLASPFSVIDEADVAAAPEELKAWLRSRRGKQVCSVVSEAVLESISQVKQRQGFEPSAPFVACLSSCMVVGEMVRYCANWPAVLQTGFQFDTLVGPQNGIRKIHHRKEDCECVSRRRNIEQVRSLHYALARAK